MLACMIVVNTHHLKSRLVSGICPGLMMISGVFPAKIVNQQTLKINVMLAVNVWWSDGEDLGTVLISVPSDDYIGQGRMTAENMEGSKIHALNKTLSPSHLISGIGPGLMTKH